jgi:phage protein U
LVDGLGRVHGLYVIENLRVSSSAFLGSGVPRVLSFTLGLTEYERG